MTEKELRKKQEAIAVNFFNRLKQDFNVKELDREGSNKRSYRGWMFEWEEENSNKITVQKKDDNYNWIDIKGSRKTMRKIKQFIVYQWYKKKKQEEILMEAREIEPIERAIEETFATPPTETYNLLINN